MVTGRDLLRRPLNANSDCHGACWDSMGATQCDLGVDCNLHVGGFDPDRWAIGNVVRSGFAGRFYLLGASKRLRCSIDFLRDIVEASAFQQ